MDCAPLNLAHFHERRADKLIKRHRYEEALKAIETSLLYVEDAYKYVKLPKGLNVLQTQKWDYERKLNQIHMRKFQYDKMKTKEIVPSAQIEISVNYAKKDLLNAQSISRSIDKTIKDFNDKYGSMLQENNDQVENEDKDEHGSNEQKIPRASSSSKEALNDQLDTKIRRLSLLSDNPQNTDDELPSLAPLDLPSFDYNVFGI